MATSSKAPPRFVPTLTEVVAPPHEAPAPAMIPMYPTDLSLDLPSWPLPLPVAIPAPVPVPKAPEPIPESPEPLVSLVGSVDLVDLIEKIETIEPPPNPLVAEMLQRMEAALEARLVHLQEAIHAAVQEQTRIALLEWGQEAQAIVREALKGSGNELL